MRRIFLLFVVFALITAACADESPDAADAPGGEDDAAADGEDVGEEDAADPDGETDPDEGEGADEATGEFESMNLVTAHSTPETFPYHDGFLKFKEVVEEETGGQVTVEVFPNEQLGDSREMAEAVTTGSIHVTLGAGPLGEVAPSYDLAALPFLIRGLDHLQEIRDSEVGDLWVERLEEQSGLKILGWFTTGDSSIQTVDAPVRSLDDLQGVRIRVQNNEALIAGFSAMGANPTPLSFGELYTSLQQGVVEGAHLDWMAIYTIRADEVLNYATTPEVPVLSEPRFLIADQGWFDSLSPDLQDVVQRAADEASQTNFEVHVDSQGEAIDQAHEDFDEITEIDEAEFLEVMEPVWQEVAEESGSEDILEGILELRPSG